MNQKDKTPEDGQTPEINPEDLMAELKRNKKQSPKEKTYFRTGGKYWRYNLTSEKWVEIAKPILESALKKEGFSDYADGSPLSPLDHEVLRITMDNQVIYAGPLAGYEMGIKYFEGEQALVTKNMDLLEIKKGEWPTLKTVLDGAYFLSAKGDDPELDQRILLYGWWQHAVRCLYFGPHSPGNALFLVGERKSGKSLTGLLIRETLGRKYALPYAWMTGKDIFNEEMFEAVVQWIDDENADTRLEARLKFGAAIKQMVAASGARMRGMHAKAKSLQPLWRMIVMLNMEPDRLMVIPPLDDDVEDKMLILKAYKKEMPMPARSPEERDAFWKRLTSELPAFLYWLVYEFQLPEEYKDRFGVQHWCHPEVERELSNVSPEQQVREFIERYFRKQNVLEWTGTTTDLRRELLEKGGLSYQEQSELPKPVWLGRRLSKLKKKDPAHYSDKVGRLSTTWTIKRISPVSYETAQL